MDEATALFATLERTAVDAPTACAGWTAHHLIAHLAAGAREMADLTEAALAGSDDRPTRSFVDREAPFLVLDDDVLRDRLVVEALRLQGAVDELASQGADASVAFAGRRLTAADLTMHGRSEAALHRWDLVGTDDLSRELPAAPGLTAHAVTVLNEMVDGSPEAVNARVDGLIMDALADQPFELASPGSPSVFIVGDGGMPMLRIDDPSTHPDVLTGSVTRLLALWGRGRPSDEGTTWQSTGTRRDAVERFLWWPALSLTTAAGV